MDRRQSRREDVARGASVLLIAFCVALLIVAVRVGSERFAAPAPTATPVPTLTPVATATVTPSPPPPPTPTPRPSPPTPTPVPVPVPGVDEAYARDGRNIVC